MPMSAQGEAVPAQTGSRSSRFGGVRGRERLAGYLFISPAFILLTIFLIAPILASAVLVFMNYDILSPPEWVGFQNITRMFGDKRLLNIYGNTAVFVIGATFFNNTLGLLLAMAVNRSMHSLPRYLLRTAIFFPGLTTTAALALVWQFLLTQDRGVVNYLLSQIGLDPVPWLSSSQWALRSVILYDVWKSVGFLMVLYLAGLQGIPESLYEAAKIDGANRIQQMRHVTLPLITPTAFFAVVISLIGAAQVFDNAYVLTNGGPGDASRLIVMYIYELGFRYFEMGYAAAMSLTLFVILILLTIAQFGFSRRWVHYE